MVNLKKTIILILILITLLFAALFIFHATKFDLVKGVQYEKIMKKNVSTTIKELIEQKTVSPEKWWEYFYSLSEQEQNDLLEWLTYYSNLTEEEQNKISFYPFTLPIK